MALRETTIELDVIVNDDPLHDLNQLINDLNNNTIGNLGNAMNGLSQAINNNFITNNHHLSEHHDHVTNIYNDYRDLSQITNQYYNNTTNNTKNYNKVLNTTNNAYETINNHVNNITEATQGLNGVQNVQANDHINNLNEMRDIYDYLDPHAAAMLENMHRGWKINNAEMAPFLGNLIEARHRFFQLALYSDRFNGTNAEFLDTIDDMGTQLKRAQDAMLDNSVKTRQKLYEQVGLLRVAGTQAARTAERFKEWGNPFYNVNQGGLALADTLQRMVNRTSAASIALSMLGPKAKMKDLNDLIKDINKGLGAMPAVAIGAAVTGFFLYRALHRASLANKEYEDSLTSMLKNLRKAFQPMVDAFTAVMVPIYKFIDAIAKLMIQFNEAHPILARMIQGTIMLIPALTLLLLPLGLGIGLVKGYAAAFGYFGKMIMPIVTFVLTMSASVWLLAAALTVGTILLSKMWKENEQFRNTVIAAWDAVKSKAIEVFDLFTSFIAPKVEYLKGVMQSFADSAIGNLVTKFNELSEGIKRIISGDFSQLQATFEQMLPLIIGLITGGIPGLIIAASGIIPAIIRGVQNNLPAIQAFFTNLMTQIQTFIQNNLPAIIQAGQNIIQAIIQGVQTYLPIFLQTFAQFVQPIIQTIQANMPALLQAGAQILTNIINGFVTMLPQIVPTIVNLIFMILNLIMSMIPHIINAGVKIISGLIQGLTIAIPLILNAALQVLLYLVNAIIVNLPMIIDSGTKIVMALVNGIVTLLPVLLNSILNILIQVANMIIANLPMIIDTGMKILNALIDGILTLLPQLINAAIDLIVAIVNTIAANLPQIISTGYKLLNALIDGIFQVLPTLIAAILKIVMVIVMTIIGRLPDLLGAGVKLIKALIEGLASMVGGVTSTIMNICQEIISLITGVASDMFSAGADIMRGLMDGIGSMAGAVWDKISGIAKGVKDAFTSVLQIFSPSRVFIDYGKNIQQGLAIGIDKESPTVTTAVNDMAAIPMGYSPEPSISSSNTRSTSSVTFSPTIQVNASEGAQGNVKQQVKEGMDEAFGYFLTIYDSGAAY